MESLRWACLHHEYETHPQTTDSGNVYGRKLNCQILTMESDKMLEKTALEREMMQVGVDAIARREPLEVEHVQYQETRAAGTVTEMRMQHLDASKALMTLQPPEGLTVSAPLPSPIPVHVLTSLPRLQQLYIDLLVVEHIELSEPDSLVAERVLYWVGW